MTALESHEIELSHRGRAVGALVRQGGRADGSDVVHGVAPGAVQFSLARALDLTPPDWPGQSSSTPWKLSSAILASESEASRGCPCLGSWRTSAATRGPCSGSSARATSRCRTGRRSRSATRSPTPGRRTGSAQPRRAAASRVHALMQLRPHDPDRERCGGGGRAPAALLQRNGHDGGLAVTISVAPFRLACLNAHDATARRCRANLEGEAHREPGRDARMADARGGRWGSRGATTTSSRRSGGRT